MKVSSSITTDAFVFASAAKQSSVLMPSRPMALDCFAFGSQRRELKQLFFCLCMMMLNLLCIQNTTYAAQFPRGCEAKDYQFQKNELVLNESGEQRLFLLFNRSTESIELSRHATTDTFMSPSLSVKLAPNAWAAFASDISYMAFECHINHDANARKIACSEALEVCEYPRAKFALSNMGNYWISANKSRYDIIQDAANKGIYLHW